MSDYSEVGREPEAWRAPLPAEVIAAVIETHKDSIGTHYPECWKYHAGCLALLLRDLGVE